MKKIYKLFFLLVLLGLNGGALWAQNNFTALQGLINGTPNGGTLTLASDYTAESNERLQIFGKSITLDLNGHVINRNLSEAYTTGEGIVIFISAFDATLTIVDSNPTATHSPAITYTNPVTNENVTVNGGIIMGGFDLNGGGIVNYGTLNLNGGTITCNQTVIDDESTDFMGNGGGILNGGIFNMSGGSVVGNTADYGGGIINIKNQEANLEGIFNMTGGTVSCNTARQLAGGIATSEDGTTTICGNCTIAYNSAPVAGGIGNFNGATTNINGADNDHSYVVNITHNKALIGGGLVNLSDENVSYLNIAESTGNINITNNEAPGGIGELDAEGGGGIANLGILTVNGCTISNNTVGTTGYGSGVLNFGDFYLSGGTIAQNSGRAGVYNSGTFNMDDGIINSNAPGVENRAIFTLTGGSITTSATGGVNNYGTFNMEGGTIGGGTMRSVHNYGTFNLSGGTINQSGTPPGYAGDGIYNAGTFNLSGSPVINADIYLVSTKTSELSSGYNYPITKAGDISMAGSMLITLGSSNQTGIGENLYDGRNIFESGAGTVTENDISLFTFNNGREMIMQYNANDPTTGQPVIEMYEHCWSGSGTQLDPYQIDDADGLACLARKVNAGTDYAGIYFQMTQNIDLSSVCGESIGNWTPIGGSTPFKGYFDGGTHTITGLYINGLDDYQGLFGYIADGAQVNNLTLGESTISGRTAVGLVGVMNVSSSSTSIPSINNCTTLSSVNITGFQFVGGICGYSHGSFSGCINNAAIVGNREVADPGDDFDITCTGGIVGYCNPVDYRSSNATGAYAISMTDCTNNGSVTTAAFGEYYAIGVGGIGGLLEGVVLTNCSNTAPVIGTAVIGGISGGTDGNEAYPSKFINCSNSGAVTASAIVGGISGDNDGTTNQSVYDNCHNTGALSSHYAAGGIIGRYNTASAFFGGNSVTTSPVIRNCSNTGDIVLEDGAATFTIAGYTVEWVGKAGGIAGLLTEVDIENCTNSGNVTGNTSYAGGIVAEGESMNISYCHNEGSVQVTDNHELTINDLQGVSMVVGGLVGYTFNSTITASYNTGNVNGGVFTAGIVGFIDSNVEAVSKCFNLGVVESNTQMGLAGGIVGNFSVEDDVTQTTMGINNCYNAGPVIGHGAAGGIVAFCETNVKDCYNVGYIKATDGGVQGLTFNGSAGIVGTFNSDNGIVPTITNCYYDKQMCPTEYDYTRIDLSTFTFEPYTASGDNLLTTNMVGTGMQSMLTPTEWSFVNGLYPQLNVVSSSNNTFDTEASLVSVTPMFLANEETVDQVLKSPFTVGVPTNLEWIHVAGDNLLTVNNTEVTWSEYGTETVAVRHTTDTQIQKLIKVTMTPGPIADGFWPDVVTEMPSTGYVVDANGNVSISSAEGLAWLISVVNGYNGQTADNLQGKTVTIDASVTYEMSDHYWVPIGADATNYFAGTVLTTTGGQVTIDGILLPEAGISRTSNVDASVTFNTGAECNDQGLFGYANGAEFHNITIGANAIVLGERNVGGICGNAQVSDFTYCINNGSISGYDDIGGIAGNVIGTNDDHCLVNYCSNNGNIYSLHEEPGGILGHITLGEIESCFNTGDVSISSEQSFGDGFAAGICGSFYNSHANNCYNTGTIQSGNNLLGGQCASGIIGDSSHNSSYGFDNSITNCYNTGAIIGLVATGIAGLCEDGPTTIENCYNTGSITGDIYASGIAALPLYSTVSGCYNTGDITVIGIEINKKEERVVCLAGGIAALAEQSTIEDCDNSGAVSFNNTSVAAYVAGICASMSNGSSVTKCHNSGNIFVNGVTEEDEWVVAGGIVATDGEGQNSVVSYCSNDGDVTSNHFAGGIWGDMGGGVINSYNTGTIRGILAGGISAMAEDDDEWVINCFNTGNIIGVSGDESPLGFSMAGGLLGECVESGTLTNCYNTGMVVGYGVAGGLAGFAEHDCAENCYNAGQVTCYPVQAEMETGSGEFTTFQYEGGLFAGMVDEPIAAVTHCYYDKQMCTQANAYTVMFEGGKGRDNTIGSFLTSEMLGVNMQGLFGTEAWTYQDGLYPRLSIFDDTNYFPNNDASITSVSPVHLVYTDGTTYQDVDNVTSPFTLCYGDNGNEGSHPVYWQHYGEGSSLYTAQINQGQVGIVSTGNDTLVAMKNGVVYKYVVFHTVRAIGETWVDVVVAEPDGYDDLDIDSPEDLAWFCSRVNGFNGQEPQPSLRGIITADIDLSAHWWVPIGLYARNIGVSLNHNYNNSFHGNHHNIDGVNIDFDALKASPVVNPGGNKEANVEGNRDWYDYLGFFGKLGPNAYIAEVVLSSGTIAGAAENHTQEIGGIAGGMEGGVIRACVSNVKLIRYRFDDMGGIVGECEGIYEGGKEHPEGELKMAKLLNCTSTAELVGYGCMGGIAGSAEGVVISNCYANAKFTVQPSGSKADSFESYVGGIVGGCYETELSNCYVRLREDSNYGLSSKDGGGEEHLFGLFIGRAEEETVKHCYAPENTGYPYIGMAETENYMYVKATQLSDVNPSQSKGDNRYMFITTQESAGNYYVMPLNTPFEVSSTEQSGTYDTYEILPQYNNVPAWNLEGYLEGQGYYIRSNGDLLKYDSDNETILLESNWNGNMYWDVVEFGTAFKMSNRNYPDICLALHNNGNGTYTFGAYSYTAYGSDPAYDFHISFFMETEIPSDGNLYGCGTYTAAVYPYTYSDPRGGTIVTLGNADEDDYATSGETTLLDALNNWVVGNYVGTPELFNTYAPDPDWARFGSGLNGDYPVHCYYEPKNIQPADANAHEGGDEFSPTAKVIVTTDKTNGYPFRYYHHVADALAYCNAQTDGGIVCVYGSDDMRNADTQENNANVDVYVNGMTYMQCDKLKSGVPYTYYTFFGDNAAAKSTDWYVSLLQDENKSLTVTTGFNLDNSDATDFAGENYDWHMVSSPLTAIPVGISYPDQDQHDLNNLPECTWDANADGLFPDDTPYGSFDFYAYSEPNYHWMNFKRNSASHWFQDTGAHIEGYENDQTLVPGHGYLIALDKELFMQAKGVLNNGDVDVDVTYSGEHNMGLNYLGNPYQSSLDFEEFVTKNAGLWNNEESDYYQSYLILDADAHCYKYYAKTQSVNPDLPSRYIWPFQGFYVGVDAEGVATFTNNMRVIGVDEASYMRNSESDRNAYPLVNLMVTDVEDKSDMFTVELGRPEWGGGRKEKDMTAGSGMLWSRHDDKEYSILFSGTGVDEIPVRFSAKKAGTFTMTWSHYNGDFTYLHLIDNMTGVDIDCLTTDSYSFEGKTDDYQSRFKLVFSMSGEDDDDDDDSTEAATFAFQMGDGIVVNGEGMLQMFDVNGRCLMSSELYGAQNTISLPTTAAGVYVLRLTSGSQVRTQKMVVK